MTSQESSPKAVQVADLSVDLGGRLVLRGVDLQIRQGEVVAILGDSACIVRPHTAAGTSKASGDAVSLAQHLQAANFDLSVTLPLWQTERLAVAERLIHHGWRLAHNSGLGK